MPPRFSAEHQPACVSKGLSRWKAAEGLHPTLPSSCLSCGVCTHRCASPAAHSPDTELPGPASLGNRVSLPARRVTIFCAHACVHFGTLRYLLRHYAQKEQRARTLPRRSPVRQGELLCQMRPLRSRCGMGKAELREGTPAPPFARLSRWTSYLPL